MLMAAESENLAGYRAQTLQAMVFNALVFGVTEKDASDGQLKARNIQCSLCGTNYFLFANDRTWTPTKSLHTRIRILMLSSGCLLEMRPILMPDATRC